MSTDGIESKTVEYMDSILLCVAKNHIDKLNKTRFVGEKLGQKNFKVLMLKTKFFFWQLQSKIVYQLMKIEI